MTTTEARVRYSLGFNFDPDLIRGIIEANQRYGGESKIEEVFGAMSDSPISSARPTSRIPNLTWEEFASQVRSLREFGIAFNFLMNTSQPLDSALTNKLKTYLGRLFEAGVERLTAGTPELCAFVKSVFPKFHVTISITYGIHSRRKLAKAEFAGADAVYLDGVYVNRDFDLLRALLSRARVECRLYANMSCLAQCPVVGKHYAMFSGVQQGTTSAHNDAFFAGCSMVKLRNPIEWLQMPWIRPEDVLVYASEGVGHFKLADRLAPTPTLLAIAQSYLKGTSPKNLFDLMERDGAKYRLLLGDRIVSATQESMPMYIYSKRLPAAWIEHFRKDGCKSNDPNCKVCVELTRRAVKVDQSWTRQLSPRVQTFVPLELRKRAAKHNY
jgi:collagenase-like PrtC family protease